MLTEEEIERVKQILRVELRSWSLSFVSYAHIIRIKSGKSDVNITFKTIVINLVDPDSKSSQIVADCDEDTGDRLFKLLHK